MNTECQLALSREISPISMSRNSHGEERKNFICIKFRKKGKHHSAGCRV